MNNNDKSDESKIKAIVNGDVAIDGDSEMLSEKEQKKQARYTKWNKRLAKIANKLALSLMVNYK